MARTAKSDAHLLVLSANWQALFITAAVLGWLSMVAVTILSYATSRYFSTGTWVFQITLWVQPVVFFVAAFVLLAHYRQVVQRIFMACLSATIGMALYDAASLWEERAWSNYLALHPISATDTSMWSAFGNEWTMMLVGLAVYVGGLYIVTRKSRR
jgi:hypothetical protein